MDFVDNMDQYHVVVVTEFVLFFSFLNFLQIFIVSGCDGTGISGASLILP